MSDPDPKPSSARPSKVTLAASLGGVSCVVLIFSLFDTLTRLRTVEMRDQIGETLAAPPFDTLTASTADVLAGMRVLVFVAGALAAAGAVLAVYVARRHTGARVGFTVVAALLLLTTPVAGMLTFLVGIAALLLWSEPARAWFSGRAPRPSLAERRQELLMSAGDRPSHSGSAGSEPPGSGSSGAPSWGSQPPPPPQAPHSDGPQPPPYQGSFGAPGQGEGETQEQGGQQPGGWQGQQPGEQGGQVGYPPAGQPPYGQQQGSPYGQQGSPYAQPYGSPYGQQAQYGQYGQYGSPYVQGGQGGGKRPGTVTTAAVLTFIGALGGLLTGLLLMAALSIDSDTLGDELRQDPNFERIGMGVDQVLSVMWVVAVVLVLWSLIAIVLAIFTMRRQQWARWLLVASAAASALLSLIAILSIVSIVPLILSVATVVLLFAGGANAWFSGRDQQGPSSGQQWSSRPGPW